LQSAEKESVSFNENSKHQTEEIQEFQSSFIRFDGNCLVIGANDVGKTNLFYAIRLLLDRSIPESELESQESDFHIDAKGNHADQLAITIKLEDIKEDAVISRLKGNVNDKGECFISYQASRESLTSSLFIGHSKNDLEEIDSRFYLKSIHFKYVESTRDLGSFIRRERRNLLKISKDSRNEDEKVADNTQEGKIKTSLDRTNASIAKLSYVEKATDSLNSELQELSHHNAGFAVGLESKSVDFSKFLDQLTLGASTGGVSVGLGGDGRNNQVLLALWKAKSEVEHDLEDEAIIYCIEEPEAHLHPHQQRKLASYLTDKLSGQVLASTHSPHITSEFAPNRIVRLLEKSGATRAASKGCSNCIEEAWTKMGYRMSVIPAEAFFSDGVLLVEGPSEVLFYKALAKQLSIDLDFLNLCLLSVGGVDFPVYINILNAMEIPWVMRTDNDVTKVPRSDPVKYRFSGLNRALKIANNEALYEDHDTINHPSKLSAEHEEESKILNPKRIYVAKVDLETDLVEALTDTLLDFTGAEDHADAIKYLQHRKAIRMGEFLVSHSGSLSTLADDDLAKPLNHLVKLSAERRS
jgi:Predicted ATP-dependent endonuclease of the OLD family